MEHIESDLDVLQRFYRAMQPGGVLVVHVSHDYRRWPVFEWTRNFDVPGHVRPGYHLPELIEPIMIKLLEAHYRGGHQIDLVFSDGQHGVFNVKAYLATRQGPLLGPLQDELYLQAVFYRCGGFMLA